jgi:hypothetical protein
MGTSFRMTPGAVSAEFTTWSPRHSILSRPYCFEQAWSLNAKPFRERRLSEAPAQRVSVSVERPEFSASIILLDGTAPPSCGCAPLSRTQRKNLYEATRPRRSSARRRGRGQALGGLRARRRPGKREVTSHLSRLRRRLLQISRSQSNGLSVIAPVLHSRSSRWWWVV